jgi:hypothetical protein
MIEPENLKNTKGFSKEKLYIISSICYYRTATVTIDPQNKVWIDAQELERDGFIKKSQTYSRSVIFIEGERFLDLPFRCCASHASVKKLQKQIL